VGLELMAKGIMAGTHSKSRRERVPNFRSCNTETAVNKSIMNPLEFVVNGVIRKIFSTKSNDVVNDCLLYFNCVVSDTIYRRKIRFLNKFKHSNNVM